MATHFLGKNLVDVRHSFYSSTAYLFVLLALDMCHPQIVILDDIIADCANQLTEAIVSGSTEINASKH